MALYDRLVDDDEDIRDIGAELVSQLVSGSTDSHGGRIVKCSLSPPAARLRLLRFFSRQHGNSKVPRIEAVRRLLPAFRPAQQNESTVELDAGSPDERAAIQQPKSTRIRPVRELLKEAMIPTTQVFVRERQNLYIDDVQEARAWAQILTDISQWKNNSSFNKWTIAGISTLTHTVDQKAERGPDGHSLIDGRSVESPNAEDDTGDCFGWASKPEVFTLGMRVILAAGVLLSRKEGEVDADVKGKCKTRLERLLTVGLRNRLHELWIIEVQHILRSSTISAQDQS